MTESQKKNLKQKLPDLLYSFIKDGRTDEILASMGITMPLLVEFLEAESFPTEEELKGFCDHFKMRYSTIKTWDVTHLETNENTSDHVTRVEVIDEKGRSYSNWDKDNNVELSFQDEGQTLKIFISKEDNDEEV